MRLGETYGFPVHIQGIERIVDLEFDEIDFREWVYVIFKDHPKFNPRDYQIDSAIEILKHRICTSEIATSAGKTLIVFLVYGYLKHKKRLNRMLFVVPNTTLVMQMKDDWEEYNNGKFLMNVRQVYGGAKDNDSTADVIVGTYQSLCKKSLDFFKGMNAVFVDECLHPDTVVNIADGTVKKISQVEIGEWVETVNEKTGEIQNREIEFVYENLSSEDMYEIETDDGRILRLTRNHKVLTQDMQWKRVDELQERDEIFEIYKKNLSYYD